jgi:hypothetical protein
MKYFLASILPRLKKASASLDQSALLVDKPWVVASAEEDEGPSKKLIFREDGRLHVSVEGEVHDGSWEYLPEANAVLIEQRGQKRLHKHAYLDEAVLALKKDTSRENTEYYVLADENQVPDGDVVGYLTEKFDDKKDSKMQTPARRKVSGSDKFSEHPDKSFVISAPNKNAYRRKTTNTAILYALLTLIFTLIAIAFLVSFLS